MRVVLLASGRSTRFAPLQNKMALSFCGQALLTWQVRQLLNHGMTELVLVYGSHNEELLRKLSLDWDVNLTITYVEQKELTGGMAAALTSVGQQYPDSKPFLLVSSNDLISDNGFQLITQHIQQTPKESAMLASQVDRYFPGGYLELQGDYVSSIVEKPGAGKEPSDLVNIVFHYHAEPQKLFDALNDKNNANDDHYELALQHLFDQEIQYKALRYSGVWQPLKYPWQTLDMAKHIFARINPQISAKADIAPSAIIEGPVHIEPGVKVYENAVIKGPAYIGENTIVATGAFVRESYIGANCVIGFNTEVARSYLESNVWTHNNYIGDSVIADNVSFGAGTKTGNYRLDEQEISVLIKDEPINTGRTKLGLIAGNNIRVGINTSFMPGIMIGGDSMIGAGIVVAQPIPARSFVTGTGVAELKIKENTKEIPRRD